MSGVRLFCGYDAREAVGFHTFCHSVIKRASVPVHITPLSAMGLPQGSNTFTLSRFLVPYLCDFKGFAIFVDASDMLCLGDIAELWEQRSTAYAVQVVKHPDYVSQHARKYVGSDMECDQSNYGRKNWASAMLINCEHPAWQGMTPERIARASPLDLLQFKFCDEKAIGDLPAQWNVMVDEGQQVQSPKLLHWTAGIPTFRHYRNARHSADWFEEHKALCHGMQYGE